MTYIKIDVKLMRHEIKNMDHDFWLQAWRFRAHEMQIRDMGRELMGKVQDVLGK